MDPLYKKKENQAKINPKKKNINIFFVYMLVFVPDKCENKNSWLFTMKIKSTYIETSTRDP